MKKIAVIGGGISGLTAAYRLAKANEALNEKIEVSVYEARPRFGGVIETENRGGLLMEKGPESFITAKPWGLELCRELGLENDLIGTNENARKSFILFNGQFFSVPQGFYLMAPTRLRELANTKILSVGGKFRAALEWFIPARKEGADESLGNFIRRRFGREILERLAQPLISGIYSADLDALSLDATFPHFRKMEIQSGSVIRALARAKSKDLTSASGARYSLFLTLREGMNRLTESIMRQSPNVSFHAGKAVKTLQKNTAWDIHFEDGSREEADAVCVAAPASFAWKILASEAPSVSRELREISYGSVMTVNFSFNRSDLTRPIHGSGFVTGGTSRDKLIGCTFSSLKFAGRSANPDTLLIRAFVGSRFFSEAKAIPDEAVIDEVCRELNSILGIRQKFLSASVARWPESLPAYAVGHREKVRRIENMLKKHPGLYLTGNAYEGTGIPDCVHHASRVSEKILTDLNFFPEPAAALQSAAAH